MKRQSKTHEEYLETIRYSFRDAREALRHAINMRNWGSARKYLAQLEVLDRKMHQAKGKHPGLASRRGKREFGLSWQERMMARAHREGLRDRARAVKKRRA